MMKEKSLIKILRVKKKKLISQIEKELALVEKEIKDLKPLYQI